MSGLLWIIRPDGTEYSLAVESSRPPLDLLQREVGGFIERVRVRWKGRLREAFVDEDGVAKRLALNRKSREIDEYGRTLMGPLVIWIPDPAGVPPGGGQAPREEP